MPKGRRRIRFTELEYGIDEALTEEESQYILKHNKELDYIHKYGYDRFYWDSLEQELDNDNQSL